MSYFPEHLSKSRAHRVCSEQLFDAGKRLLSDFSKYKFGGQLRHTNMVARRSFRAIPGNRANGVVKAWDQFVVGVHQTQFKFYTNDNSRRPFNYRMKINLSTSSFDDGVANEGDHLSLWAPLRWVHCSKQSYCKDIHLCAGMCQQKLQAGFDIHGRSNCTQIYWWNSQASW